MMPRLKLTLLSVLLLMATTAGAEQVRRFGDLKVYYIAFTSAMLEPDIAERYGIVRAGNRAVVNISARRVAGDGATQPTPLEIRGRVTNLVGQNRALSFREVRETGAGQKAIYYLDTVQYSDEETLRFELLLRDPKTGSTHPLSFQQKLWHE